MRSTAEETKQAMLRAASEMIRSEGLVLDFANLSMGELIRDTGVSRSTVFRVWGDKQAFVADLVEYLDHEQREVAAGFSGRIDELVDELQRSHPALMATPEGRDELMRVVARQGVEINVGMWFESVPWRMRRSLAAAVSSLPGDPEQTRVLRDRLRALELGFREPMAQLYARMAQAFGRRFVGEVTPMDMAVISASLVEGVFERRHFMPEFATQRRVIPGPRGDEEWEIAALAIYGTFLVYTEEVPAEGQAIS